MAGAVIVVSILALLAAAVPGSDAALPLGVPRSALRPSVLPPSVVARHARTMDRWRGPGSWRGAGAAAAATSPVISPVDFGADPTGVADSTPAFARAMAVLLNRTVGHMSEGIADLGGAVLDLGGGAYSLSAPLVVPQMYGNMRIVDGTLRARPGEFPAGAAVLQIGASPCTAGKQASCNENIGLSGLTVDGSHVAGAAIAINSTMGATLDSSSAVFGFVRCGIALDGGHEAMVSETWVAAYFWDDPLKAHNNATGICVDGNDHYVTNVIVFSALVGVSVNGGANLLSGVHTWNTATGLGGVGILVAKGNNRFEGNYLDYTDLCLLTAQSLSITSSFFLGGAQLEFRALEPMLAVSGVYISGSVYSTTTLPPFLVNETSGSWASLTDVVVEGLVFGALPSRQPRTGLTKASKVYHGACVEGPVAIDLSDTLVFPSATTATRSITGVACDPAGSPCNVVLSTEQPNPRGAVVLCFCASANGTKACPSVSFTVTVDQSVDSALQACQSPLHC